ncbi:lipopolysaccharide biosynthesis protein [Pelosinus sp. UFO1]|uniref:lipopolysaccharide biosynthesis protein n=1 Tax=Pelosinus sp. UFO1 TaxID=484770 RepID=UPI0004D1A762|nr:hypothetical protein [Pelosinus sp. UFO1]AIF53695.1 hypothetical protein UFO1_4152 [Pelosinus sp. UFO1]
MIDGLIKFKRLEGINKSIFINSVAAFVVRGLALIVSLFTMPAYMKYFENQEILGLWFTMISVLSWILTFDLGIGNGLRNRLVRYLMENDMKSARIYISSSYIISSILAIIAFVLGYLIFPFISWNNVFNISSDLVSSQVLLEVIILLFSGMLLQFVLKLIYSIFYALQKSVIPNVLSLISSVLLLTFVIYSDSGSMENNLKLLAKANIVFTIIPLFMATIIAFLTELRFCIPSARSFKIDYAIDVMKLGGVFFWLQIMSLLLTGTNEFLIAWFVGNEYVVEYQIYSKLFSLVGTIFTLALTPIWSAVTKAFSQDDFIWIRKLYKKLKFVVIVFIIGEFVLISLLQFIVNIWLGENTIKINIIYALIFAVSGSLYIWHSAITSIVNGIGKLKIQFIWLTLGGLINIPVAYILFQMTGSWISIVGANIISLIPYCVIQPLYINKYLKLEKER